MAASSLVMKWKIYSSHFAMILVQLCFVVMSFMTNASFNVGLNALLGMVETGPCDKHITDESMMVGRPNACLAEGTIVGTEGACPPS